MGCRKEIEDARFKVLMGFDGFVDRILRPMKIKNQKEAVPFRTIAEFSEYLMGKSGKSCSIDLEIQEEKIGGNMPIVANAMGNLGCQPICIGAMGRPEVLSVFQDMDEKCTLLSVGNPGYCDALEFQDGKLMLAINTELDCLNYEKIISIVSEQNLIEYFRECDAIAFLNWGEMICSNEVWRRILEEILPQVNMKRRKIMFVDFSDLSKRGTEELLEMIDILKGYEMYFDITISLNENELDMIWGKLNSQDNELDIEEKAVLLAGRIPHNNFVIHLLESSCYVKNNQIYTIPKEVIKEPKIITGGGDNFNAGLLFGLLKGFDIERAISLGAALSCLYVKHGRNVCLEELLNYKF